MEAVVLEMPSVGIRKTGDGGTSVAVEEEEGWERLESIDSVRG